MLLVLDSSASFPALLSFWASGRAAVTADVNWLALSLRCGVVQVGGCVLEATGVGDSISVSKVVDGAWLSSLAVSTSLTVDNSLSTESSWSG